MGSSDELLWDDHYYLVANKLWIYLLTVIYILLSKF